MLKTTHKNCGYVTQGNESKQAQENVNSCWRPIAFLASRVAWEWAQLILFSTEILSWAATLYSRHVLVIFGDCKARIWVHFRCGLMACTHKYKITSFMSLVWYKLSSHPCSCSLYCSSRRQQDDQRPQIFGALIAGLRTVHGIGFLFAFSKRTVDHLCI